MEKNVELKKTIFYDFFSYPQNPEDLFTLLHLIDKNDKYDIYKALNNETKDVVCIKIISYEKNKDKNKSKIFFQKLKEEISLMKYFENSNNIIQFRGSYNSFINKNIWIIYEYCPCRSIFDLITILGRPLIEDEISIIVNGILQGLIDLHQLNIVHQNIKLTNILISEDGTIKLSNFSNAIQNSEQEFTLKKDNEPKNIIDIKYDILLLGILCIELVLGIKDNSFNRQNFLDDLKNEMYLNNENILEKINIKCSKKLNEFIKKCLEINTYKRPTAFELILHPFITEHNNTLNKNNFISLIKSSIEKIEKKKNKLYDSKFFQNFNNSINTNKNTIKNNTSIINKNIQNNSILNPNNNITENNILDPIEEFRIKKIITNDATDMENDKNDKNSHIYSNINEAENSFDDKLKESAMFGKSNFSLKRDELNKANSNLENENKDESKDKEIIILKNDNEIDYEEKWDYLDKFQQKFNSNFESSNNINYNYNSHILKFDNEDSKVNDIDYNDSINPPINEFKCDIIHLNASIQKENPNKYIIRDSEYYLKNSIQKNNETTNCSSNVTMKNIQIKNTSLKGKKYLEDKINNEKKDDYVISNKNVTYLYKYLNEFDTINENENRKKQTQIIKINKKNWSKKKNNDIINKK